MSSAVFHGLAVLALLLHLLWLGWVIFGYPLARRRRVLRNLHLASLGYGIFISLAPLPCPLTQLEQYFQQRAGLAPYEGGFLLHYLEAIVYPNVSPVLLAVVAVGVCLANLALHARAWMRQPA